MEQKVRIEWEKAKDKETGLPNRMILTNEAIRLDFNDRLLTKEVSDYDDYKDYVCSIDRNFRVIILNESLKKSLIQNQNDYFRTAVAGMQEPQSMMELLQEYISENQLLPNGWQEG